MIVVDPPWKYANWTARKNGAAQAHYEGLKVEELAALPVGEIASKNSVIAMWITHPKMLEACHLPMFEAWGFRPACVLFDWVKTYREPTSLPFDARSRGQLLKAVPEAEWPHFKGVKNVQIIPGNMYHGNGFYTAGGSELCILGVRGRVPREPLRAKQVLLAPRAKVHSAKPNDEVRRRLQILFPGYAEMNKIELFARSVPEDWTALGNELAGDGRDIRESLPELVKEIRGTQA